MLYHISLILGLTIIKPNAKESEQYIRLINHIKSIQGEI